MMSCIASSNQSKANKMDQILRKSDMDMFQMKTGDERSRNNKDIDKKLRSTN